MDTHPLHTFVGILRLFPAARLLNSPLLARWPPPLSVEHDPLDLLQGEPLHNYDPVLAAIDILADGLGLSRSKIIVSSVSPCPSEWHGDRYMAMGGTFPMVS